MNCIEKLQVLSRACEPCFAKIIEFEELPEHEKFNYDYYEKNKDYLVYCEKCHTYDILDSGDN